MYRILLPSGNHINWARASWSIDNWIFLKLIFIDLRLIKIQLAINWVLLREHSVNSNHIFFTEKFAWFRCIFTLNFFWTSVRNVAGRYQIYDCGSCRALFAWPVPRAPLLPPSLLYIGRACGHDSKISHIHQNTGLSTMHIFYSYLPLVKITRLFKAWGRIHSCFTHFLIIDCVYKDVKIYFNIIAAYNATFFTVAISIQVCCF